jgi:prepilin-type N-terminal cleavage/methylation domain-containing protein
MKNHPITEKTWPTTRSHRQGFSLVELLVVIVIIVVLAAVAMLVTGKIRTRAYQANAMSSLRQVAAMNVAYSTENNGDINTLRWVGDPKEGGGGAWVSNSFWGRLQPFLFPDNTNTNQPELKKELNLRLNQFLNTPNSNKMTGTVISGARIYHDGSGLPVPFAFNSKLHKWNQFLKVSSFNDPSTILYATYGFGFFDKEDGQEYVPHPTDGSTPKNNIYYLDGGIALGAFLDGHVESIRPPMPDRNFESAQ